jgi:hypothetical protein
MAAALVVLAQFFLLWLVYRAAQSGLPGCRRRCGAIRSGRCMRPTGCCCCVLWGTTPAAGLWRGVLFGLAILYPVVIWRCAYLVLAGQHGRMAGTGIQDHLLYLWPAYGGSSTPYGKGLAYLSQNEARTPEALARSQLGGLKLLLLAVVWRLVLTLFEGTVYGPGNGLTARHRRADAGRARPAGAAGCRAPWWRRWRAGPASIASCSRMCCAWRSRAT